MSVSDSLPRKREFDSMLPPDGFRIGETGTRAALVKNSDGLPCQLLLRQFSIFIYYPTHSQQAFWMWRKHDAVLPHTYKSVI